MFLQLQNAQESSLAAIDNAGGVLTYGNLFEFSVEFNLKIKKRCLIFILTENTVGSLAGYVGSISAKVVPLLLSSNIDKELFQNLFSVYQPEYLWVPNRVSDDFDFPVIFENFNYKLLKTNSVPANLNENLSLLLTTSGSTGSPKLVRHSYLNLEENAKNVASFFELTPQERPICILPMNYTMGLSVITSHLYARSTLLLFQGSITDKEFWSFIQENKATSLTGVPYTFEVLHRFRLFRMNLPHLKTLSQGGGKLKPELFKEFADFASNTDRKFFATYGQTEGTARMAFLNYRLATTKIGSIGNAIPNGQLSLIDDYGNELHEKEATGEMIYRGPNVTLGYALNRDDLSKGDENHGVLKTGDIATRDSDGCYFIIGRRSRFLKIFGTRIGLDETEQMVKSRFNIDCICSGTDEKLIIKITERTLIDDVHQYVINKTGLFHSTVEVVYIEVIPRNESGKAIY